MDTTIELLEKYGLIRDEDSLRVTDFSKTKIRRLHRELYSAVFAKQVQDYVGNDDREVIDPFSFVASKSLSGQTGCWQYFCRLKKLDVLGRYAALYSTRIILPLPLQHPSNVDSEAEAAQQLSHASLALLRLRPLVDAGLIFPVVMRSPECEHTIGWTNRMIELAHELTYEAAKDFAGDYQIRFQLPEKSPTGIPSIYIEGPEEFLEHGGHVMLFNEPKEWRLKSWRFSSDGMVELRGSRKLAILYETLSGIADDTTFYLAYGKHCNARYLASRKGETFLLDLVTRRVDEELSASSEALNAYMTHSLPLLGDLPLAKLLKIRREDRDSFVRYRLAVGRLLAEVAKKKNRIGKREVLELFREQIEPELVKMKSELNQERKRQIRRIAGGIGAMAASLALGAFGKVFPLAAGGVGVTLLGKAAQSVCEHGSNLREKNDFYFLLRLTQEAEMN